MTSQAAQLPLADNDPGAHYDDAIVKKFLWASLVFGIVAFLVGVLIACQMYWWQLNFDLEWLTFGRLRPLHTNAAIFAFAGNAIFAGIYHSTQRLCRTRLFSDTLSNIHFWGWQLIIVGAAISLPLGYTHGKEYAELEWPLDIAITAVWVVFAWNFFGTLKIRREKHMYVAIWFYIATIITVAVLHIINSLEVPVGLMQSYPIWAGVQDAMVQWWYGHNAVAFFLTTPFLGLMYYYIPKAANRPVYSYRLSIIHFWALVFIYIWAGPHHLLNTSLPDWAQTLGMVFSLMLWAPSWGGMINGLLTLRGAWHLLRTEPVIKFLVAAVTFYGMATFEGPLMSIKSVNSLAHYTDWIIGHVHAGALGWNGMLTFGMAYYLVPKLWKTQLHSKALADAHFWTALLAILIYYLSMVTAGITQGLMWRGVDATGHLLYPDFVETVMRIKPLYLVRAASGGLFLIGALLMMYNLLKTIAGAPKDPTPEKVPAPAPAGHESGDWHRLLEGKSLVFSILVAGGILVGSAIEILPTLTLHQSLPMARKIDPWSPLELAGRDIYIREGCYVCHSQMIRKLPDDVLRYGEASRLEETQWDHPFQWGSKRTGPDLARVGPKYSEAWHYRHMINPRIVVADSIMPNYPWLVTKATNFTDLRKKLSVLQGLGVPYTDEQVARADTLAEEEARIVAQKLIEAGAPDDVARREITALVAYLMALGNKEADE